MKVWMYEEVGVSLQEDIYRVEISRVEIHNNSTSTSYSTLFLTLTEIAELSTKIYFEQYPNPSIKNFPDKNVFDEKIKEYREDINEFSIYER